MNPRAKLSDLIETLEFDVEDQVSRFDRQTGRMAYVERHILSAVEEGQEAELGELPEWQKHELEVARAIAEDSGERFIDGPDKFEFHEYRQMEQFIETLEDADAADQLWRAIRGKGAFRYFKDTADRLNLLERWYRYREEAMKQFVIQWAKTNQVPWEDDTRNRQP